MISGRNRILVRRRSHQRVFFVNFGQPSAHDPPNAGIYVLAPHPLNITSYAYLHNETDLAQYVRAVEHEWVTEFNWLIGPTRELGGMRISGLYATCQISRASSSMTTFKPLRCTAGSEIDFRFCTGSELTLLGEHIRSSHAVHFAERVTALFH